MNLNWFKKLFASDEKEYEEEYGEQQQTVKSTGKKTPFRFPLISDEEKNEGVNGYPKEEEIIEIYKEDPPFEEPVYKPLYTQDIWQQRAKQPTVIHRAEKKIVEEKVVVDPPTINRKKRAFTPTEVPSPVYGFSRIPLNKKVEEIEQKTETVNPDVLYNSQAISQEPEVIAAEELVHVTDEVVPTELVNEDEQVTELEKNVSSEQELKSVEESVLVNVLEKNLPVDLLGQDIPATELVNEDVQVTNLEKDVSIEPDLKSVEESVLVNVLEKKLPVGVLEQDLPGTELVNEDVQVTNVEKDVSTEPELKSVEESDIVNVLEKKIQVGVLEQDLPATELVEEDVQITNLVEALSTKNELVEAKMTLTDKTETNAPIQNTEILIAEKPVKENIRPFNVLMLKSDKSKMNKIDTMNKISPVAQKIVPERTPSIQHEQKQNTEKVQVSVEEVKTLTEQRQEEVQTNYVRPSISHLLPPEMNVEDREWMEEQAFTLIDALSHFQVTGEIVQMVQGPAVTQFEITVGQGTKVSKIRNLADDLKLALAAKDIRIQAPIPGKSSIGIEIPNRKSRAVRLSEVINTDTFLKSDSPLEAALGLDLTGKPVTLDLRKMPHGLIAGATGSGKSVFINSLLVSLLYKATPDEVKLLLIDPKMVELAPFNHIPHLVSPVITDVKAATAALKWAVEEMERRYQLFAHIGVRDISRYNTLATEKRQFAQKLPYIVIVIDELADLMMMAPTEVEDAICRIAQKARACGIHLVLATQRPSVDVITGLIKANIPTRIAFSVSSQIDSRTILDQQGAERLLGKGDMLYQGNGMSSPVRIQGTYVSDDEIESVIEYARSQGNPDYLFEQEELLQKEITSEQDELFEEACRFIVEQGTASTSLLQRKFHLGYNRAARLIDAMYENGYITEQKGSKARDVLLTSDTLEEIFS